MNSSELAAASNRLSPPDELQPVGAGIAEEDAGPSGESGFPTWALGLLVAGGLVLAFIIVTLLTRCLRRRVTDTSKHHPCEPLAAESVANSGAGGNSAGGDSHFALSMGSGGPHAAGRPASTSSGGKSNPGPGTPGLRSTGQLSSATARSDKGEGRNSAVWSGERRKTQQQGWPWMAPDPASPGQHGASIVALPERDHGGAAPNDLGVVYDTQGNSSHATSAVPEALEHSSPLTNSHSAQSSSPPQPTHVTAAAAAAAAAARYASATAASAAAHREHQRYVHRGWAPTSPPQLPSVSESVSTSGATGSDGGAAAPQDATAAAASQGSIAERHRFARRRPRSGQGALEATNGARSVAVAADRGPGAKQGATEARRAASGEGRLWPVAEAPPPHVASGESNGRGAAGRPPRAPHSGSDRSRSVHGGEAGSDRKAACTPAVASTLTERAGAALVPFGWRPQNTGGGSSPTVPGRGRSPRGIAAGARNVPGAGTELAGGSESPPLSLKDIDLTFRTGPDAASRPAPVEVSIALGSPTPRGPLMHRDPSSSGSLPANPLFSGPYQVDEESPAGNRALAEFARGSGTRSSAEATRSGGGGVWRGRDAVAVAAVFADAPGGALVRRAASRATAAAAAAPCSHVAATLGHELAALPIAGDGGRMQFELTVYEDPCLGPSLAAVAAAGHFCGAGGGVHLPRVLAALGHVVAALAHLHAAGLPHGALTADAVRVEPQRDPLSGPVGPVSVPSAAALAASLESGRAVAVVTGVGICPELKLAREGSEGCVGPDAIADDIRAFGELVWQLYTRHDVPRHQADPDRVQGSFPPSAPLALAVLAASCTTVRAAARPGAAELLGVLAALRADVATGAILDLQNTVRAVTQLAEHDDVRPWLSPRDILSIVPSGQQAVTEAAWR